MSKFWIVLSHTYFSRLKSKAFIITTLIVLLFIVGAANIESIIQLFSGEHKADQVIVIDESDELFEPLQTSIAQVDEDIELILYEKSEEEGKTDVQDDEFDALLVLKMDENDLPTATYYENNASWSIIESTLEQQLQQIKTAIAAEQAGFDEATLESINEQVAFEKVALDEGTKTEEELNQARGIVYVMLFVLYMAVIIYGQMIATDVATEKSSRVMEILISSASPVTHMFAKIIGIALLGLTQMLLFFVAGYSLISTKANTLSGEFFEVFGFTQGSISIYVYAILFFI